MTIKDTLALSIIIINATVTVGSLGALAQESLSSIVRAPPPQGDMCVRIVLDPTTSTWVPTRAFECIEGDGIGQGVEPGLEQ